MPNAPSNKKTTRRDLTGALIRRRKAAVALLMTLSIGVAVLAVFSFLRLLPLRGDAAQSTVTFNKARLLESAVVRGNDAVANRDRTPKEAQAAWETVANAARTLADTAPESGDDEEARALRSFRDDLKPALELIDTAVGQLTQNDPNLAGSARRNAAIALGRVETGCRSVLEASARQLDQHMSAARLWLAVCLGLVLLTGLMMAVTVVTWAYANYADRLRARRLNPSLAADEDAAEAALRLSVLIDRGPLAVVEWTNDLHITRWSGRAEEIFGRKPSETIGKRWDELPSHIHVEDKERVEAEIAPLLRGDTDSVIIRHRNLRPDGTVIHCVWYNCAVRDGNGKPSRFLSLATDVTREVLIEQAFRNEAMLVRRIADAAPLGISIADKSGTILFANNFMIRAMGARPEDVVGTTVTVEQYGAEELDGTPIPLDQRPGMLAMTTGEPIHGREARIRSPFKAEPTAFSITAVPLRDARGQVDSVLLIHDDITERIAAESEHEALTAELSHARRLETVGNLAGGIAHDFGNALLAISYAADALSAAAAAGRPGTEHATQLRSAIDVARELTSSLVNYAAGRDGTRKPIDLAAFAAAHCKFVGRLLPPQLKVVCQPQPASGPIMVNASVSQLLQVLMNLAVNARDAMPDGGVITISVGADLTGPAPAAVMEVSDTGQGMSPEARKRAFDRYFTTKEPGRGTGIGLSTVRHIVQDHGGTVDFSSVPGQGTRFVVRLPLIQAGQPAQPVVAPQPATPRPDPSTALSEAARAAATVRLAPASVTAPVQITPPAPSGKPSRALLVESDDRIRPLIVQTLRNSGYQVESFTTMQAAIEAFQQSPASWGVALIELDSGGAETAAALRRMRASTPSLPALLLTSDAIDAQAHPIDEQTRVLLKPFTVGSLRSALKDLFSQAAPR